ncbi:hypothetical protein [Halorubrum sp. 48-1-W]|uniref:hypothetical protein n=1 Tax=Halorubrum sp. 48-1-W TaxID=2249761 RepID=UPI000FCB78F0|nr:hypothetical protein [Halorubrum sp. 48-1-W]
MPEIQVDWYSREEADRLRDLRDRHGMIWRGVLLEGAKHAESIDLLKALVELHPELAYSRPGDHAGVSTERTNVTEQLHEQIRERQRARSTTEIPLSGFTDTDVDANANGSSDVDSKGDSDHKDAEHFDVSAAVAQVQENRTPAPNHMQRSVAAERTREREYERWDAQAAQTAEDGGPFHPADAHEDVEDVLRHHGDHDEWDMVDPRYDYEGYADEYDGDFR